MKRILLLLSILVMVAACGGYSDKREPLSAEEMQVSEMATTLKDAAAELQSAAPSDLQDTVSQFSEASLRFQNLCLRYGSNSLEARKAFDRVMFLESQITHSPSLANTGDFNTKWQALRTGTLQQIAKTLGYRPEKLSE